MNIKHIPIIYIFLCIIPLSANAYEQVSNAFSMAGGEQKGGQFSNISVFGETIVIQKASTLSNVIAVDNSVGFLFVSGDSPLPPTGLFLDPSDDHGISPDDNITNRTSDLTINGFAENEATVELFYNNTKIPGESASVYDNTFSIDIEFSELQAEVISITAIQTTRNSGVSAQSEALIITIDTIKPDKPTVTGLTPTTSKKPECYWTSGGNGANIYRYILDDVDRIFNCFPNNAKDFSPETNIDEGYHTLYVQEQDIAGNWSEAGFF